MDLGWMALGISMEFHGSGVDLHGSGVDLHGSGVDLGISLEFH